MDELEAAARASLDLSEDSIRAQTFPLPVTGPFLKRIQHDLEQGCGATRLTGLNPERLARIEPPVLRRLFLGLAAHLGTPLSQSAEGQKIFSVRNAGYDEDDPRARGPNTAKKLSFHTDRCDVIGFFCLQQAVEGGENLLVSSMAIYNHLLTHRPELVKVLCEPFWFKRHNVDTANDKPFCRQPIFSFRDGYFACSYLRVLIDRAYSDDQTPQMTGLQREALDELERIAEQPDMHVRFGQKPGEILLLNNWVTLHRRTAFRDHVDPARRRHILRLWLSVPNSRPLDPLFADNYGSIAAGAIRGGMRAAHK
ncbi:MAG: TauD/TfdA family dioxygenase [Phycisphaeraceae bacterium]|nr:TauD/TfdA family dioxygenase [Phycisphaeraceae bacterium]